MENQRCHEDESERLSAAYALLELSVGRETGLSKREVMVSVSLNSKEVASFESTHNKKKPVVEGSYIDCREPRKIVDAVEGLLALNSVKIHGTKLQPF